MVRLIHQARQTVSNERGVVLVITSFMLIGLLGVAALVVDIVVVNQAQLRAQATVDASVLAAAQDIADIPLAVATVKEYAQRNYGVTDGDWAACVDPAPLPVATALNCITVDDAVNPTHIRVRLPARSVPAFFATALGKTGFSVNAAATAEIEYVGGMTPGPITGDPVDLGAQIRAGDPGGGYDQCENYDNGNIFGDYDNTTEKKWAESIFVFEHLDGTITVLCDTSLDDAEAGAGQWQTWFSDAGGNTVTNPTGIEIHVSCSDNFVDGWTDPTRFSPPQGPLPAVDPEWRIVRYTIVKYNNPIPKSQCGETFTPLTSEPPAPIIRLSD